MLFNFLRQKPYIGSISSIITLLFIGVTVSETSYSLLPTTLPLRLQAHITGIYKDTLFLFGGNSNAYESCSNAQNNMKWYKLDLKSLQMSPNVEKTDISSIAGSWVEIQGVTMPDYGPQAKGAAYEGQFWCPRTQCSAVVGKYLFVVVPAHCASPYGNHRYIYRIDLSHDPPVFSNKTDFVSTIMGNGESGTCVTTDGTDLYYAGGCTASCQGAAANSVYRYDVSADNHEVAFAMSGTYSDYKRSFGCAWNHHMYKQDSYRLYVFLGDDSSGGYLDEYEYYDTTTQSWSGSIATGAHHLYNKCINNPFTATIECATGILAYDNSDTMTLIDGNSFDKTVALYQVVRAYTMEHYIIHLTATEGCAVMFVLGGVSDSGVLPVYNYMQYALRCATLDGTDVPTFNPTTEPTVVPTKAPSEQPSATPSKAPTDTSGAPSVSPTGSTATPTSGPSTSPSYAPTVEPTGNPSNAPSKTPTASPSDNPVADDVDGTTKSGDDVDDESGAVYIAFAANMIIAMCLCFVMI